MHRSNHTIDRATHYPRITSSRILGQEWIRVMDAQPSTVVMRCNSESSGIHTYVRMYEKRIQWEVQRRLLAVNTEDGEIARRWERGRQRDLILLSDARPSNMILSTEGARARMRAAKNHLTALRIPSPQPPLLSAAHRLAARSPV